MRALVFSRGLEPEWVCSLPVELYAKFAARVLRSENYDINIQATVRAEFIISKFVWNYYKN